MNRESELAVLFRRHTANQEDILAYLDRIERKVNQLMTQVSVDQDMLNTITSGLQTVLTEAGNANALIGQLRNQLAAAELASNTTPEATVDLSSAVSTIGQLETVLGNVSTAATVAPITAATDSPQPTVTAPSDPNAANAGAPTPGAPQSTQPTNS